MDLSDLMQWKSWICSLTKGLQLQGITELLEEATAVDGQVVYWDARYKAGINLTEARGLTLVSLDTLIWLSSL